MLSNSHLFRAIKIPVHVTQVQYGTDGYKEILKLRDEVLRKPLKRSIYDDYLTPEKNYIHIAAYNKNSGKIVGTAQIIKEKDGVYRMKQFAVKTECQKQKIGEQILEYVEKMSKEAGAKKIYFHAREIAIPFYTACKYEIISDTFYEVGIPHKEMQKIL